jgi:hypothetical protein
MITKELIEERKAKLQADMHKVMQASYEISGALQDCDYWLEQLEIKDGAITAAGEAGA